MNLIKSNSAFLKALAFLKPKQRKVLIETMKTGQLHAIAEIVGNLLAGVIPPSPKVKLELSKRKGVIRKIGSKGVSDKARRLLIKKNSSLVAKLIADSLQKLKEYV